MRDLPISPKRPRASATTATATATAAAVVAVMLAWLAAFLGFAMPAGAHPHVWVTVETTVLFDKGSVSGFRHKWTFDELYTAMAVEGLDTNKDGIYSREELAELAKVNIEGLAEFQYFTQARLGNAPLAFEAPKDYWLDYGDKVADPLADKQSPVEILPRAGSAAAETPKAEQKPGFFGRLWALIFGPAKTPAPATEPAAGPTKVLSLNFTLPLKQPVLTDAPDFNFAVFDPSFFIALELARTDPVRLGPGAPATCRIELGPVEGDDAPQPVAPGGFANQTDAPGFGFTTLKPIKLQCGPRP